MATFTNQRLKEAIGTISAQHLGLPLENLGNGSLIPDNTPLIVEVTKIYPTTRNIEFRFKNTPSDNIDNCRHYIAHANVDHWYTEGKDKDKTGNDTITTIITLLSMLGIPGTPALKDMPLFSSTLPSILKLVQIPEINTPQDILTHLKVDTRPEFQNINNFNDLLKIHGLEEVLNNSEAAKLSLPVDNSLLDLNSLLHLLSVLGVPGVGAISNISHLVGTLSKSSQKSVWPFGVPENTNKQLSSLLPLINMIIPGTPLLTILPLVLNTAPTILNVFASPFQILDRKINVTSILTILSLLGISGAPPIQDIPLISKNLPHILEIVKMPHIKNASDMTQLLGLQNTPGFQKINTFHELLNVPHLEEILNTSGIENLPNLPPEIEEEHIQPQEPLYATVTPINGDKDNGYLFLGFIKLGNGQ